MLELRLRDKTTRDKAAKSEVVSLNSSKRNLRRKHKTVEHAIKETGKGNHATMIILIRFNIRLEKTRY